MDTITERLAGVSLVSILVFLTALTAARGALYATRVSALRFLAELLESVVLAVAIVFLVVQPFFFQHYFIPSGSMHPTLLEGDHVLVNKLAYRLNPPERGDVIVFRAPIRASPDEKEFIKRLVGLPGDLIEVEPGYITVGLDTYSRDEIRDDLRPIVGDLAVTPPDGDPVPLRLTSDAIWIGNRSISGDQFAAALHKTGQRVYIHPGRVLVNGQMLLECCVAEDPGYHMPPRLVGPNTFFVLGDNRNDSDDSHLWGMLPADRVIGRADYVFWPLNRAKRLQ